MESPPARSSPEEPSETELLQCGFRFALALSHHRQDAEDLTQEAWVKLCRRYGGVRSRAALFTTIRHLYIDRCRRDRIVAFLPLDETNVEADGDGTPSADVRGDLEQLLGTLRPGEREVIFLHHVQGHTAEEIGSLTQQPRGTVLSLLHRAFKKLQAAAKASSDDPACNQ